MFLNRCCWVGVLCAIPTLASAARDPSGVVYENIDGAVRPVEGAQVFLVDDTTGTDLPRAALFGGGQGQTTTAQGLYRFVIRSEFLPGTFSIRVVPPSNRFFPSAELPPVGTTDLNALGVVAPVDVSEVVVSPFPDPTTDPTYYLRFELDGTGSPITNNHIPVDGLGQAITAQQTLSHKTAAVGELVTVEVSVTNPLGSPIALNAGGTGGLLLVNHLPPGLRWVRRSGQFRVTAIGGTEVRSGNLVPDTFGADDVVFPRFDVPARSELRVRYQLTMTEAAGPLQVNRVAISDGDGNVVARLQATIRRERLSIFEEGTLWGRVVCTDSARPASGVRVFLDTGYYVDTDRDGRYHFRGIRPGRHLVKLDPGALGAQAVVETDNPRELYISEGLPARVVFDVRCGGSESVGEVVDQPTETPEPPALETTDDSRPDVPPVDYVYREGALLADGKLVPVPPRTPFELKRSASQLIELTVPNIAAEQPWRLTLLDVSGSALVEHEGVGPEGSLSLPLPPEGGAVQARFSVVEQGWRTVLTVPVPAFVAAKPEKTTVSGSDVLLDGNLSGPMREAVEQGVADALRLPQARLHIEVHGGLALGRSKAQLATARAVGALLKYAMAAGLPRERIDAQALGATKPILPGTTGKANRVNRRIVFDILEAASTETSDGETPDGEEVAASTMEVRVFGTLLLPEENGLQGKAVADPAQPLLEVIEGGARTAWYAQPTPAAEAPETTDLPVAQISEAPLMDAHVAPVEVAVDRKVAPLRVWLPEANELSSASLALTGRTEPGVEVRINGEPLTVDSDGGFAARVDLSPTEGRLTVEASRPGQRSAVVARKFLLPESEWFLLGLGHTALGQGPLLAGMDAQTTRSIGDEVYVHGRAVAYLKGRVRGTDLARWLSADDVRVTAHGDTRRSRRNVVLEQIIDPEQFYPVYGDASEDVQDAATREHLYVLVEAGASELEIGNVAVTLDGLNLYRFRRSGFGGRFHLERTSESGRTFTADGFVTEALPGSRHRQVAFQGTGGSMVFLPDRALIEGTERVALTIRDAVTGHRLHTVTLARDTDYRIFYAEGRVVLNRPIPSTVGNDFRGVQNLPRTLRGHSVFVEVEYDYQGFGVAGDPSFGVRAQGDVTESISVGGTYLDADTAREGFNTERYRLASVQAAVQVGAKASVETEFAWSEARDSSQMVSVDGGISFGELNTRRRRSGFAGHVRFSGDASGWLGLESDALPFVFYGTHQDKGFVGGGEVFSQGQTAGGMQLSWRLSRNASAVLRHDGVASSLVLIDGQESVQRHITAAGYAYRVRRDRYRFDVSNALELRGSRSINVNVASGSWERRLNRWFTLSVAQEFITQGRILPRQTTRDRLATTVGAEFAIHERLSAELIESVRWSGSNSTQVGLKTQWDGLSVYARERISTDPNGTVATTIVGSESRLNDGSRSYVEYQADSLTSDQRARTVMGMDNQWQVTDALGVQVSYERTQLVGLRQANPQRDVGANPFTNGFSGAGSGALGRNRQFAASSYTSGFVFPTGVASRDAVAGGLQWKPSDAFRCSFRGEYRLDRADHRLNTPDRSVWFGQLGSEWRMHRDWIVLGRARGASVRNDSIGAFESQFLDVSLGVALRPVASDRVTGLAKWTRRYERSPLDTTLTRFQLEVADVVSLEPVVELGYGIQWAGKFAMRLQDVFDGDLPTQSDTLVLGVSRINYHLSTMFDAGVEYRFRNNTAARTTEHGALAEFVWLPHKHASIGVGYNFSRFSDDLLNQPEQDTHGPFVRASARF